MPGSRIPPTLCTRCKGYKKLCGLPTCPILARFRSQVLGSNMLQGSLVEGATPPCTLVGESGYPKKTPVILYTPPDKYGDEARQYDDPRAWHDKRVPLSKIIEYRSYMVGGIVKVNALDPWRLYEKEISLAAASTKPVATETRLRTRPTPMLRFDGLLAPHGPSAPARRIVVSENPTLPRKLEAIINDDARAVDAVTELYTWGIDYYTIITAFSLGLLGRLRQRRLVPTRWAITAVDDIVATSILRRVRTYKLLNEYLVYNSYYLGNNFTILLMPGPYMAEMIEIWHPLTPWTREASKPIIAVIRETRNGVVNPLDGGYMAARVPVLQYLDHIRRQAAVLIVREVTRDYYAPVGNWHIRETVKEALTKPPFKTQDLSEAIEAIKTRAKHPRWVAAALQYSRLLRRVGTQKTLDRFLA